MSKIVKVSDPVVTVEDADTEPFMLRERTPNEIADFEHCIRAWGKGITWCDLNDEQYAKLK